MYHIYYYIDSLIKVGRHAAGVTEELKIFLHFYKSVKFQL